MSLSSQEDLSITKYSEIGCLILKSDKQFIVKNIQENILLPYQTFYSSHMTIELCFRLCRRWIILMFNNEKICICLYTINKPYEFNEYLGEFLSIDNCTSNHVQIYSLTEDIYILPSLLTSTGDDWSLDGCYYLQNIGKVYIDLWLTNLNYIQAIDFCRIHCQKKYKTNYYSYLLSRKKYCYCFPVKFSQAIKTIALRKPLIHCSFLPYICHGFSDSCEKYYSETNADTLIKIDVHNYCLSSHFISFIFDRIFYMCFKSILLQGQMTFSIINYEQECLPITIKTREQWNYLIQSSWITYSRTFISTNRNSTFIFKNLFQYQNLTLLSNNLCIIIIRRNLHEVSYDLIQCTLIYAPGYVLCAQKPFQSINSDEEIEDEFQMINNNSDVSIDETSYCPSEFILFNKKCYYIHSSFTNNIQSGERLCYNQYSNSTLVKFDSHEWGNINTTRFLGRTYDDMLLEFFYYSLEKKLFMESRYNLTRKHWLRLLLGDKNDPNECVLRYFTRSTGAFMIFHRCNNGGHPVCQCEPIRKEISTIISTHTTISYINTIQTETKFELTTTNKINILNSTDLLVLSNITNQSICNNCTTISPKIDEDLNNNETKTESMTTSLITQITFLNFTDSLVLSNTTIQTICENCTITNPIADEDLVNNETTIDNEVYNDTFTDIVNDQLKKTHVKYHPLIVILTGPILAFIVLFIGIGLLIRHLRQNRGTYSTRSSIVGARRTKRSSTIATTGDVPNTPAARYSRSTLPRFSLPETVVLLPLDNSIQNDDNMELLSATKAHVINDEEKILEDNEESLYARLK